MTSTSSSVSRTRSLSRWPSSVRGLCSPGVSTRTSCAPRAHRDAADGVPGGLRLGGGDRDLLADQGVGQRRLAGVRAAHQTGEPRPVLRVPAPPRGGGDERCPRVLIRRWPAPSRHPPGERLGRRPSAVQPSHDHGGDPVASAGHLLGGERQPGHRRVRPGDRDPADRLGQQAADGVDLLLLDVDVEEVAEVVDAASSAGTRNAPSASSSTDGDSCRTRRRSRRRSPRGCPRW